MADDEPSEQDDAIMESALAQREDYRRWRNEQFYDGVLGRLPAWVPEPHQERFEITRNRLLYYGAYGKPVSPDVAVGYLNIYTQLGEKRDSTVARAGAPQDGPEWIPPEVMQDVAYLAHVRWCVSLGEDQGLHELAGRMAARGAAYTRRTKKGGEKGAQTRWEESKAPRIEAVARRMLSSEAERRGLAATLSPRFGLSPRHINRILKKAGI